MSEFIFTREQALAAIEQASTQGLDWLYRNYPKPGGISRLSTTGFLLHEGQTLPVKPLGRLANEIAGRPMKRNPTTNYFRQHFASLGFQMIDSPIIEATNVDQRQKALAEVWKRPNQARFRLQVFEQWGAKCIVSGCETLTALEAAHIMPVANGGDDEAANGLPLRADLHRLFDANLLLIDFETLAVRIVAAAAGSYASLDGHIIDTIALNSAFVAQVKARLSAKAAIN